MKRIISAAIFILILNISSVFAQTAPGSVIKESMNKLNKNYPDPFSEITLIQFYVEDDSYVRLFITDKLGNEITELADGLTEKGEHYVYYKRPQDQGRGICKCVMKIYSGETNTVTFSDEMIMNYDNENKFVLRK